MLHFIRDISKGWVSWLIVGLISIPFALWGVNSYVSGANDVVVAKVNGQEITQAELQQSVQQYRDQMRSALGDQFDPRLFDGVELRQMILEDLIQQRLLFNTAVDLGQIVPDQQIAQFVRSIEAFQIDGQFDADLYRVTLARVGFTPAGYESQLRNEMMLRQLMQHVERGAVVSQTEIERMMLLESQERRVGYGVISVEDFLEEVTVDQAVAREYYDANIASYTVPEQVSVQYLRLSADEIASTVEIDEAELVQFYADNRQQFIGAEQRRVSHILVEGDDAAALAKIEEAASKLAAGESFAAVAADYSDDTGSAVDGGDLGYIQLEVMEPAFETVAFSLNEGDVSEPVQTRFGYHLILVTDIQGAEGQTFEEAREQIEQQFRQQRATANFYQRVDALANLTFENPDSLDVAANELELEIQTTPLFTRDGGQDLLGEAKFIEAAFSDDVLNQGVNSAVIELSDTDFVVVHKNDYKSATAIPFETVSDTLVQSLRMQQASDLAAIAGEALITDLTRGTEPSSVFNDTWQAPEFLRRDSTAVNEQVLRQAFTMTRSDDVSFSGFTAQNGNYIVVGLYEIKDGDVSEVEPYMWDGLAAELTRFNSNAEIAAFIESLRASAKVQIYTERLTQNVN